jgi:hypothetical protein
MAEIPWTSKPSELFRSPLVFFPSKGQTPAERGNALSRLVLYTAIIVGAYRKNFVAWVLGGVLAAFAVSKSLGGGSDKYEDAAYGNALTHGFGGARGPGEGACTRPSKNNPFANALVTDFGNPNYMPACSLATPGVENEQRDNFNSGLVRSIYDPWNKQNNQRTWYTLPSPTNVADMTAVRNFLYGTDLNCKGNLNECASKPMCKEDGGGAMCTGFFKSAPQP